jgi:hypothetical protein
LLTIIESRQSAALMLEDDPAFTLDLGLPDIDPSLITVPSVKNLSQCSSFLSPITAQPSQLPESSVGGIAFGNTLSSFADGGRFDIPGDDGHEPSNVQIGLSGLTRDGLDTFDSTADFEDLLGIDFDMIDDGIVSSVGEFRAEKPISGKAESRSVDADVRSDLLNLFKTKTF